jgi:hypothetical protein
MTVEVINMQGGAGGAGLGALFEFTDDFSTNRVRQLYHSLGYGNFPGGMEPNIVLGQFLYDGGSASGLCGVICTGAPALQGQANQFMEIQLVSAPALLSRIGPALKVSGEGFQGVGQSQMYADFLMQFTGTLNLLGVYPLVPGGNYTLALAIGAPAQFDIFELEVQCGLASNRVRAWQNGVLLADVTDADANRVVAAYGFPGWAGGGSGTSISTAWDNLSVRRLR